MTDKEATLMFAQIDPIGTNYLHELYEDLYVKSAVDINATIGIISWILDLASGENLAEEYHVYPEISYLPGKPPRELIAEFERFRDAATASFSLDNIFELRNSLYRFQSL
jgi:hypothetical protein